MKGENKRESILNLFYSNCISKTFVLHPHILQSCILQEYTCSACLFIYLLQLFFMFLPSFRILPATENGSPHPVEFARVASSGGMINNGPAYWREINRRGPRRSTIFRLVPDPFVGNIRKHQQICRDTRAASILGAGPALPVRRARLRLIASRPSEPTILSRAPGSFILMESAGLITRSEDLLAPRCAKGRRARSDDDKMFRARNS